MGMARGLGGGTTGCSVAYEGCGRMAVSYELYIRQKGRWNLEAQFNGHQRQAAIDEAKELEQQSHIEGTKVVREKIDDATGESSEQTIFNSDRKKTGRLTDEQKSAGGGGGGIRDFADMEVDSGGGSDFSDMTVGGGDAPDIADASAPKAKAARRAGGTSRMSPMGLAVYKLFIVLVTSFGFAALVTWIFLQTELIAFA